MPAPRPLDDAERGIVLGLVRQEIRKVERNAIALRAKTGDAYDPTAQAQRLALLESAYAALGGDPARITRRPGREDR